MRVLYFASLKDRLKLDEERFTLETEMSVGEFVKTHIEPRAEYKLGNFLFAVNEEMVDRHYFLKDEDTLAILPPLSGGES